MNNNTIAAITSDNKEVRTAPDRIRKERKDIFIETSDNIVSYLKKYNDQVKAYNEVKGKMKAKQTVKDTHFMRTEKIFTTYLGYHFAGSKDKVGKSKIINNKKYMLLDLAPMLMCRSLNTPSDNRIRRSYTKADLERMQRHYDRLEESEIVVISKNERNLDSIFLLHSVLSI